MTPETPDDWERIKIEAGRNFVSETRNYLRGYIRALEDLLRETSTLRTERVPRGSTERETKAQRNHWYGGVMMWKAWRRIAGWKLHKAREALSNLEKVK